MFKCKLERTLKGVMYNVGNGKTIRRKVADSGS